MFSWMNKIAFWRKPSLGPEVVYTSDLKKQYKSLSKNELIKIIFYFIQLFQDPRIKKIIHEKSNLAKKV